MKKTKGEDENYYQIIPKTGAIDFRKPESKHIEDVRINCIGGMKLGVTYGVHLLYAAK
jgi:hypothetical protein